MKSANIKQAGQLDNELACLFGRQIVEKSKALTPEELALKADLVAEGARRLREQKGYPDRQRAVVDSMSQDAVLALCKWISEPDCMAAVVGAAKG